MSETWVWNESLNFTEDATYSTDFISNANQYSSIQLETIRGGLSLIMSYDTVVAFDNATTPFWTNEAYRTITFATPPTGDLLTFLQANATKQSTGGIGLKNLSSYNQDLSVPRKKDVDAKQDKITVNGIVQGDGTGNLSAVETVNADLLDLNPTAVGLGNVDNVKQYSVSNPPPYPVTSVNGQTGAVTIDSGGIDIQLSTTQPIGQSVGDYWYHVTGTVNI